MHRVFGIDFTSSPRRGKPITCACCVLDNGVLSFSQMLKWEAFTDFEHALLEPGPWIVGADFPFGQASRFIHTIGWPTSWSSYVRHASKMGRAGFRSALDQYRKPRPPGDKEHRRHTDLLAGSISPQKLFGVPVGLMFFEGAPRLLDSGVTIPQLLVGDPDRIVVEAYPALVARQVIGRQTYKQDARGKQTADQLRARHMILESLNNGNLAELYGFSVRAPLTLCDDPSGDHLDALLCAVQAAWSWSMKDRNFGAPEITFTDEGWIADPNIRPSLVLPGRRSFRAG